MLAAKRDTPTRSTDVHLAAAQDKPRGFFSFLTWPFLLVQALAAEAAVGGMLRPSLADDENGDSAKLRPTPTSDDGYETALREPGTSSGAEEVGPDARAGARASIDTSSAPTNPEIISPKEVAEVPSSGVGSSGGNVGVGTAASGTGAASSANTPDTSSIHQGDGGVNPALEVMTTEAFAFPLDLSGGMHEAAAPIFAGIGLEFDSAEAVMEFVADVLSAPVSSATDLISMLESAPMVEGVSPAITAVSGLSGVLVGNAVGTAESLLGIATHLPVGENESRAETSESITALTDMISDEIDGLPLGGMAGGLGSGGIITFEEPSDKISVNDLFANGSHTDYGLSLRTEAVAQPISSVVDRALSSDEDLATTTGQITDGGEDVQLFDRLKSSDAAAATSLSGDVSSTLEDIGLRSDSLF